MMDLLRELLDRLRQAASTLAAPQPQPQPIPVRTKRR